MAASTDDTIPGESPGETAHDDTMVAEPEPTGSSPSSAHPRIRPSRPTLPATQDYPTLTVVDPAHYVIGGELARGGMGRIQIARDRRLGREVAVKEVLVSTGSIARRFEREARITARLQHPSIISVHEAGTWPSGEPFYAMRLVTGKSLDEAIDAATTYAQRLALLPNVLAIADAMAYAHGQKVVHRDLKPRNVVVGEFGETVVLDWGLAKELGIIEDSLTMSLAPQPMPKVESTPGETTLGEVLGTPAYMPPEQAAGAAIDERADVYAIGSILYHVLAGRAPFVASSNAELLAALHAAPPLPVSHFAPEVPTELAAIVARAMARDREARYPTARALAEDLRRFQNGQLVGAHRYSIRQLVRRWGRKHRTGLAAVAAAVLMAMAVGVVAVRRIVAAEADAQSERTRAIAHRSDAEQLMGFMLGDLRTKLAAVGKLDLLEAVARRAIAYYDAHAAEINDDDAFLAGTAHLALGGVLDARGDTRSALAAFSTARTRFAALATQHPEIAKYRAREIEAAVHRADNWQLLGDRPAAAAAFRELLPLVEQNLGAHPDDADSLQVAYTVRGRLGNDLETAGELADALAQFRTALALAERLAKVDDRAPAQKAILATHAHIGRLLAKVDHDPEAALTEYRIGLALGEAQSARDPKDPHWLLDVALSHEEVGTMLKRLNRVPEALVELRAAIGPATHAVAIDPSNAESKATESTVRERLGIALFEQKDYAGALAEFKLCDAIWVELVAQDPANVSWQRDRSIISNKLGDVALATKDVRAAIASYAVALAIRTKLVARDHANSEWRRDLFYSHYKLAAAYAAMPDRAKQLAELRAGVEVAEVTHAAHPKNETFANDAEETHVAIAELMAPTDPAAARLEYKRALEITRAMAVRGADPVFAKHTVAYEAALAKLR